MFIFIATDIPGLNKSPGEILNGRKYRTGLPMIDLHRKSTEDENERLSEKHFKMTTSGNGKELAKLPVGTKVLYEQNPDLDKTKRPKWCKGTIKYRSEPRKYEILTNNDRVITQSRHHIKGYTAPNLGG